MAKTTFNMIVTQIGPVQKKTETFSVMEIIGKEADSQYDNFLKIQATNKTIDELKDIRIGSKLMLECYINGKIWNDTVIMNINISKVGVINNGQVEKVNEPENEDSQESVPPAPWEPRKEINFEDDLPF
jgi:hypothetical protein